MNRTAHHQSDENTDQERSPRTGRRTAVAVGGAVAVVAVLAAAIAVITHDDPQQSPALPPVASPSASDPTQPAAPAAHQPPPGVLDVSDLPTGDAPATDYLMDGVLHFADGGTGVVRTTHAPRQFVEMEDGARVWLTGGPNGEPFVEIQDADGTFHDPVPSSWGLSVNPSHGIVAWLTRSGQVMVWEGRASEPRPLGDPIPGEVRLGPVTGEDCSLACTVYVNQSVPGPQPWQPWEVRESGAEKYRDGGYVLVNDISASGLTVGYTEITDVGTCSKLLGGGELRGWSTCAHTLASFSPDGRTVLADPAYHDGIGNGQIAMYDAGTGDRLFQRHTTEDAQGFYGWAEWEDDTHVLASVFQDGRWALVRFAADGSMEYAVTPVRGKDLDNPFVLPVGATS